ncbi:Box C/D snoRNA protein 1 [Linnemannia elongata]|nr:Box C/D snoRNA protein 1 [Linnemannia elongata]
MDFFANAFVTRDVVDSKNMVVKDGIHIREKALSSEGGTLAPPPIPGTSSSSSSADGAGASGSDIVNCEVCGTVAAKYKCPGCFCQTCSLACSKQHKLDTTCSGVRSRTHFVERKQYTEHDMMSDYNFLEEVGRKVDNAARENIKLEAGSGTPSNRKKIFGPNGVVTVGGNNRRDRQNNNRNRNQQQDDEEEDTTAAGLAKKAARDLERLGAEGSGSYRDKQLILQAKKRGTHLIMMADGLKKRKENHTNWKEKLGKLNWTIEWLFPEIDSTKRILEHRNDDSMTLRSLLTATLSKEENKEVAAKYAIDTLDQCRLYFVIPLRHANQPALYPLSMSASLQEALKFKKVLECPTILVLGPGTSSSSVSETPAASEQDSSVLSSAAAAATDAVAAAEMKTKTELTTTEATPTTETEAGVAESAPSSNAHADKDKSTTATVSTVTAAHPLPTDHTHSLLEKYTIEEPPTQWPKKPTAPATVATTLSTANQNNKRPSENTKAAVATSKKAKLDNEGKEDVEMSEEESNDSSDEDSDSSDDESSGNDDSSDDSADSSDNEDVAEGESAKEGEGATVAEEDNDGTTEDVTDAELKIGQAILEAFNQDFGGSAAE